MAAAPPAAGSAPTATTVGFDVAILMLADGRTVLGIGSPARGRLVGWPITLELAATLSAEAGVAIQAEPFPEIAPPGANPSPGTPGVDA